MGEQAELAWESGLDYLDDDEYYEQYDKETHWKQKNGKLIAIDEMEITHVRNTVRMLRRKELDCLIPSRMIERITNENKGTE